MLNISNFTQLNNEVLEGDILCFSNLILIIYNFEFFVNHPIYKIKSILI